MAQKGPNIYALDGQLGVVTTERDNVVGLITNGVTTAQYTTLGTVVRLTKLSDATERGFNAGYDFTNNVQVYSQIWKFFNYNPEGIMYLMVVAKTVTQVDMINTNRMSLIKSPAVKERIGVVAFKRNPVDDFSPVIVTNVWKEATDALALWATKTAELEAEGYFPGALLLDGSFGGSSWNSALDLRALNSAAGCSIVIGQDPADALGDFVNYADMATALALFSMRSAAESIGAPKVNNPPRKYFGKDSVSLTDTVNGKWISSALTSNTPTSNLSMAIITDLKAKGYMFFDRYAGYPGIYGAGGGSAVSITSDYAYLNRYNVLQKAKYYAYRFFVPYMESTVELENGKLSLKDVSFFQNAATLKVIDTLYREGNISDPQATDGVGVFLPNEWNFITGEHDSGDPDLGIDPETLVVQIRIPIKGILRSINIYVGLKAA